ncbi:unnamed protein product [Amoebophrya sp. A25]|nr:unnamed protein product [Amoebophrya sp. A25]|eukprot:GSA25T00023325001.1
MHRGPVAQLQITSFDITSFTDMLDLGPSAAKSVKNVVKSVML